MNYNSHYNKLIDRAKNRKIKGYTESHHIVPRCLGGTDDKTNLTKLTAREHFVAHILLVKIYPKEYGLINAVNMMTVCNNNQERVNNRMYGWLKEKFSKRMSQINKGMKNSQFGTMWISNIELEVSKKVPEGKIPEGWVKGRNVWKSVKRKLKKLERNKSQREKKKLKKIEEDKQDKEKRKLELEKLKLKKIKKLTADYLLFRKIGFDDYKTVSGYDKSYENLVMQFKKYVEEYESFDHKAVKKRRISQNGDWD